MNLFADEKPGATVALSDLFPDMAEEILVDTEFDIFRAGQRTFRNHWFRIARQGNLPPSMTGEATDNAGNEFIAMLATPDGFNAGVELIHKGVVAEIRNYPAMNGDGSVQIVESSEGLTADERYAELYRLADGASELLVALLMASFNAEDEHTKKLKKTAKKSSASSRAKRAKQTRKSAE